MSRTNEERLDAIERALIEIGTAGRSEPDVPDQSRWTCSACQAGLGWLDPNDGVVRRKIGGDVTYVTLGQAGKLVVICGPCGQVNTLTHQDCQELVAAVRRGQAALR